MKQVEAYKKMKRVENEKGRTCEKKKKETYNRKGRHRYKKTEKLGKGETGITNIITYTTIWKSYNKARKKIETVERVETFRK